MTLSQAALSELLEAFQEWDGADAVGPGFVRSGPCRRTVLPVVFMAAGFDAFVWGAVVTWLRLHTAGPAPAPGTGSRR